VEKYIIVIAGMSGTGKTTFGKWLSKELKIPFFSKDKFKEQIYDCLNNDLDYEQKRKIGQASYTVMYGIMGELMKNNYNFIVESNFNKSAIETIENLKESYKYNIITVKFECEYRTLHSRFLEREKMPERHKGLLANGEFDKFEKFYEVQKRANEFKIDENDIIVDTTDFSKVDYKEILKRIKSWIENNSGIINESKRTNKTVK